MRTRLEPGATGASCRGGAPRVPSRSSPRARRAASHAATALALVLLGACGGGKLPKPADLSNMVAIPAGEFTMGREGGDRDESPQRRVWLDAFHIDRTEVRNRDYKVFCDATGFLPPANPDWDGDYFRAQPDQPALNLTFDQARAYCAWMRKRLPTEAEWEKAARGTDGRTYPWGSDWADSLANFHDGDAFEHASPVGSFARGASPYGVLDMAGNVWEWCADWYAQEYYASATSRNPTGPTGPALRHVVRGGSYSSVRSDAEVANRDKLLPTQMLDHVGCRCAWSPRAPAGGP